MARARVLVVGAGGLGCAVLPYLAAAGVGHLVIVDPDRVEETNLHRQPLFRMGDIGHSKVAAARAALLALNPQVRIEAHAVRVTPANAAALIAAADVVIDAADSLAVTYVLSDACQAAGTAAGERLGARARRLRRRLLRRRAELPRRVSGDAAHRRLLR